MERSYHNSCIMFAITLKNPKAGNTYICAREYKQLLHEPFRDVAASVLKFGM